jgi:molybdate transport system ATP-binding protein
MSLQAAFGLNRGSLALDVGLAADEGETVALVGPNGAGKTTCLLALAGLLRVERGCIQLGGRTVDGGPGGPFVAAQQRNVGFVFQDHLLFPHLTALENVAFGLCSRGVSRTEALAAARTWLERVGLGEFAEAKPATLSGGQAQRVALARALVLEPALLLLDEPLAAVDASARLQLRRELRAHLQAFAGVRLLVVHAPVDAFALADRIAVIEQGRIVQCGTVAEICGRPRSRYVADLVGLNFFRGPARGGVIELPEGGRLVANCGDAPAVMATLHPRAVSLFRERPSGSPRNVWQAPVLAIEPALDCVRVQVGGPVPLVAEITPGAQAELRLLAGEPVWLAVKATEIQVSPG